MPGASDEARKADSRPWQRRGVVVLLAAAGLSSACAGGQLRDVGHTRITDFFHYMEAEHKSQDTAQEERFFALFTQDGRKRFLDRFGGLEAFRVAAAAHRSANFPWPGRFRSFTLAAGGWASTGAGKVLGVSLARWAAPIRYQADGVNAVATTMSRRMQFDIPVSEARLYRFRFEYVHDAWKIADVQFEGSDPTIANSGSLYSFLVGSFIVYNALALLPGILAPRWTAMAYLLLLRVYMTTIMVTLNSFRAFLRTCSLAQLVSLWLPLLFGAVLWTLAVLFPDTFNSHVGFLLTLLLTAFVLSIALVREVEDHYWVKGQQERQQQMRDPRAVLFRLLMTGRPPEARFDAERFQAFAILTVVLALLACFLGFLPYRNKFGVGVVSEKEMAFTVENRLTAQRDAAVYRIPRRSQEYATGAVQGGAVFTAVERAQAQDGVFFSILPPPQMKAVYIPAEDVRQAPSRVSFKAEGEYIRYLEQLGAVQQASATAGASSPQARAIAEAYERQGDEGVRLGTLEGLTRALNDFNRGLAFDPGFAELYVRRAYALTGIGRLLREEDTYNLFGLWGSAVSSPTKANILFVRALENLVQARERGADRSVLKAVECLVATFCGRPSEAAWLRKDLHGNNAYVLEAQLLGESDREKATRLVEELLRADPGHVQYLAYRAQLLRSRDPISALRTWEQARRISPDNVVAQVGAATAEIGEKRASALAELDRVAVEHPALSYRARFLGRCYRWNRALIVVVPILVAFWIRSLNPKILLVLAHTVKGAAFRLSLLLVTLLTIAWMVGASTLPRYGVVSQVLPPPFGWLR
jgi:tetratricopeptide (TPR) repeat protein